MKSPLSLPLSLSILSPVPLFSCVLQAGSLEREVQAVDSEFKGVLQSDHSRLAQLMCHTVSEGGGVSLSERGRGIHTLWHHQQQVQASYTLFLCRHTEQSIGIPPVRLRPFATGIRLPWHTRLHANICQPRDLALAMCEASAVKAML